LKQGDDEEYELEEVKGIPRNFIGKTIRIDNPPERSVFVEELDKDNEWVEFFEEFGFEILIPLMTTQGNIGVVAFGEKIGKKPYTEREVEFLDSLSNIAATAVANGLNVEEIQKVNRSLDRKIQQLNTIFDISRELNSTLDRKKIGSLLSFAVMGELLVNRCIVFTKRVDQVELLVAKGVDFQLDVTHELAEVNEPLLLINTKRFEAYREIGIAILVPMRLQDETRGILAIGPKISGSDFDEADLEFLTTLGNQAMSSLENARLFEDTLEKQRMEEELNLARKMQQGLLPSELPILDNYEIAALNVPSRQVGGDYYDIIPISDNLFGIAIADVSGKGAGAALLMANIQASLHALASGDMEISEMVERINQLIFQNTDLDKFITFFYGQLDINKHTFTYCNAGHNPPFKVSKEGKANELMVGGIVLGMMPDLTYETGSVSLSSGDRIIMFTDGITEAAQGEEEFGDDRVMKITQDSPDLSAQDLMDNVVNQVNEFVGDGPQADDITILVLKALKR